MELRITMQWTEVYEVTQRLLLIPLLFTAYLAGQ
jgi:hypothetical protein